MKKLVNNVKINIVKLVNFYDKNILKLVIIGWNYGKKQSKRFRKMV
ncbi:MAG: hypothetical protein IJD23_11385 [Spirochaetaceae bacterium]|nr:hypothetical protein [Spirochaetaceae bacterium]